MVRESGDPTSAAPFLSEMEASSACAGGPRGLQGHNSRPTQTYKGSDGALWSH